MKPSGVLLAVCLSVLLQASTGIASAADAGPTLSWGRLQLQLPSGWVVEEREDGSELIARFEDTDEDVRVTQFVSGADHVEETAAQHLQRFIAEQAPDPEVKDVRPFAPFAMPGGEPATMQVQDLGDDLFFISYAVALDGGELYTVNFFRTDLSEAAIKRYSDIVRSARFAPITRNASKPVPIELVGHWVVDAEQAAPFPARCRSMWLDFSADGNLQSGGAADEYKFSATIDARATEHGFVIEQTLVARNSKPNCQGLSAEYVSTRFKPDIYVEVHGDTLRFFLWERGDSYLDYHRVSLP